MKLFYYKDKIGNFGDDLNPWIWYSLYPNLFDNNDSEILMGAGTLINSEAPKNVKKYVFGSGVGYHETPAIDSSWEFLWVRGPLSAQKLGLERKVALTDPAILAHEILKQTSLTRKNGVAFMPHHKSIHFANWRSICLDAGITYLDPTGDIHQTLHDIRSSTFVIAEAMHAAIVADSLRIPWVPVVCYDHILAFKWQDWCSSMDLEYSPIHLNPVWDIERNSTKLNLIKSNTKRLLNGVGISNPSWSPPIPKTNVQESHEEAVKAFERILKTQSCHLSKNSVHSDRISSILETIQQFSK
ncbi:polysaccharide pyruvyl transferase family protein [Hydrogenophaga sp. RAC07]|uniref:polysaccharide pyruvyl transferase family protein n=1 Tax=Hydrogenophaga sp. RAC07 TaxID=1842537 RepID=UPI0008577669|nr:polysaccharide pyruvyl transferase family protein [Hydrogenophaga sp. RAC07]AOF84303.1 polysaccharide pyruvyl transferase family protein [Hydrogenophaga sp. RAC07]